MSFGVALNNRDDNYSGLCSQCSRWIKKLQTKTHKGIANAQDPEYVAYRDFT